LPEQFVLVFFRLPEIARFMAFYSAMMSLLRSYGGPQSNAI
jgi:hypothetical protein